MKRKKIFFAFICCSFALLSCKKMQQEQALTKPQFSEQENTKLLAEASMNYFEIGDTANAKKFLWQSVKLSKKLNKSRYAGCYPYMAMMTWYSKQQANRIRNSYMAKDSLLYAVSHTTDAEAQVASYLLIASMEYTVFGNADAAPDLFTALSLCDKIKDSRKKAVFQALTYADLAVSNEVWQSKESFQYLDKLRALAKKNDDSDVLGFYYFVNIFSFSKVSQQDKPPTKMERDSAIFYAKKMWNLVTKQYSSERGLGNKYFYNSGWSSYNLYIAYSLLLDPTATNMNIIKEQIAYTEDFSKKNNTYKAKIAESIVKIIYFFGTKDYAQSEKYGLELLELSKQNNDKFWLIVSYTALSDIYKSTGRKKEALEAEKNITNLKAQVITEKVILQYEVAKVKFELDLKHQEIALLQTKNRLYIAIGILSAIILGYVAFLFFKRYKRYKLRKENMEQDLKDINVEKEKVQKSLIATNLQMIKKNEALEKIIKKSDDKEIQKIVTADKRSDRNYEDFRTLLSKISPEFYQKLQDKASNKLSNLDLKYCAYILIGLGNKELMDIFSVEYNSVSIAKNRIKKKLNLEAAENLNEFLKNLSSI